MPESGAMIEIQVPEVVPSLNRLMRLHWAARRRLLKKWEWIVFAEVYRVGGPLAIKYEGRMRVRITRRSGKLLDQDNLVGSAKIVLDALKNSRLIADDSPLHIELICDQETGRPMTKIQVSPINASLQTAGSSHEPPREPVSC